MSALAGYSLHMRRRGFSPTTISNQMKIYRAFDRDVGLLGADRKAIDAWLDARHLSARSRYSYLSQLSCFYEWAMDEGLVNENPTARIVRPRLGRYLPRPISDGDLAVALDMAGPLMRAWLTLGAYAGFRCVEMARLRVEDIHRDTEQVRAIGKGSVERLVPLHPLVLDALARYHPPRRGYVFLRPRGGPFPAPHVSRTIGAYLRSVGVDATAHQLRHWFGTKSLAACGNVRVVQGLMGHAELSSTAIYTAFTNAEARAAVLAMGGAHAHGDDPRPGGDADGGPVQLVREGLDPSPL